MTDVLDLYKRELLRWNKKINLIGPEVEANLDDHVAEALEAARILRPERQVLDFGSGGGLPAVPMAIVSRESRFHLVESDKRKWAFLKQIVRACKLDAVVYGERLDRVLGSLPRSLRFSLVTSRAVGKPQKWLPSLAAYMEPGGRAALFQSSPEAPEMSHFVKGQVHKLPRGFLVMFHVEQS